jgi:hypothetical protein
MVMRASPGYSRDFLCRAIGRGDSKAVRNAVANGIDCNALSPEGLTPLMEAAQFGRTAIAKFLVSIGADVNARAECGLTALILAASRCRPAIVEVLLKNGATAESGADGTNSILRVVAAAGDWTSMRLFLLLRTRSGRPARRSEKRTRIKSRVFSSHRE